MLTTAHRRPIRSSGFDQLNSKYEITKLLGQGTYGKVYLGVDRVSKEKVAVKKMSFPSNVIIAKQLFREVALLGLLNGCPYIVSLKSVATSNLDDTKPFSEIALIFEYLDTSLDRVIASAQAITPAHIQYILHQILLGIHHIHSAKLVHRDLKPSNILINSDCKIKIADLGMARANEILNGGHRESFFRYTPNLVTLLWRSPEVILGYRADAATDMWSIGCILAELILRHPLFIGIDSDMDLLFKVFELFGTPTAKDCNWIQNPKTCNSILSYKSNTGETIQEKLRDKPVGPLLFDLLLTLLEFNPTKRLTTEQALRHPWMDSRFNAKDLIPFSLRNRPAKARKAWGIYYGFEKSFDLSSGIDSEMTQYACELILLEAEKYTKISSSASTSESSELIVSAAGCSESNQESRKDSYYETRFFKRQLTAQNPSETKLPASIP